MTKEMVGGCCVCSKDEGWDYNPLVYCDGQDCIVAVHKACYGIIDIPSGHWFCRKCESQETNDTMCKLCPSKDGALKRTDNGGWAHVVCALYIPEIEFENVSTMEPIVLKSVPLERYNKSCCICETHAHESKAKFGACMNCNKPGCMNHFHVTCGQAEGLLCVKRGYSGPDDYLGYCPLHRLQLKKKGKLINVPAFKPPSAAAGERDPPIEMASSVSDGNLEHLSGSSSSHERNEKKPKEADRKSTTSADIIGDSASPSVVVDNKVAPDNSSEVESNQVVDKKTEDSKSSERMAQTSSLVLEFPILAGQLSAPSMDPVEQHPSAPSAPNQGSSRSVTPTNLCDNESTLSNISDFGFSLSSDPTLNDQITKAALVSLPESAAHNVASVDVAPTSTGDTRQDTGSPPAIRAVASTSADSSVQNQVEYTCLLPTNNLEKEIDSEPFPAPAPHSKKQRRRRAPKALDSSTSSPDSTIEKRSSKRRKKETKMTADTSSLDLSHLFFLPVSAKILLHPPSHPVNHEASIQETEHDPPETSSTGNPMSEESHPRTESPGPSSVTEETTTSQNNLTSVPQMLGNQLNPASSVAQEMSDLLSAEVDMHNAFTVPSPTSTSSSSFVGVPFPRRRDLSPLVNSTNAALSIAPAPHHLADLLERQWEQGNQFFMEEGQRYDIASLLSCLHTIRQENSQLENNVASLTQRRNHLLAVNARLSVPLTVQTNVEAPFMTNSGYMPDETSMTGYFTGHSMEVSLQDARSRMTPYSPQVEIGMNMPEHLSSYIGQRVNTMYHSIHPNDGSMSMSPAQGSSGFSMMNNRNMSVFRSPSSTPEMAHSTPPREQQMPRLQPHNLQPMLSPAGPSQYSLNARQHRPLD